MLKSHLPRKKVSLEAKLEIKYTDILKDVCHLLNQQQQKNIYVKKINITTLSNLQGKLNNLIFKQSCSLRRQEQWLVTMQLPSTSMLLIKQNTKIKGKIKDLFSCYFYAMMIF